MASEAIDADHDIPLEQRYLSHYWILIDPVRNITSFPFSNKIWLDLGSTLVRQQSVARHGG
jgi:hypothetical protein